MEQIANSLEGYVEYGIGMFPKDWKIKKVGEVCKIFGRIGFRGYTVKDIVEEGKGAITLSPSNIQDNNLVLAKCTFISWLKYEESPEIKVFNGDILLVKTGSTFGKTAYVNGLNEKATVNPQIVVLKRINTNPRFLAYVFAFKTIQNQITATIVGGAIPTLSQAMVANFELAVPSTKAEQTAIANALSDIDVLIQSLTRLIAKKRQIKQGAMQTLLNSYENGRLKAGWVVKKLGDVANICRGASPRPIDSPKWFDENSDIGWVRISDITRAKKYLKTTVQKLTAEGVKHSRYVPSNNLIMSICATVGRPILNQIDVCIHDGFVVFGNCTVDKQYLFYFLDFVEQDWSKHGQTGSQMNLNTRLINDTVFPMPEVFSEQTRIATILSGMDAEIAALETKLVKYQHIKQGMM